MPVTDQLHNERILNRCLHEVAEFVDARGWDQPAQMFALVRTADVIVAEPTLGDQLDDAELTPIAQDPLPTDIDGCSPALEEFLATTSWPAQVAGCVLVQQVVVLPPAAESDLDEALVPLLADRDAADEAARATAAAHPDRRDARLFSGVLRDGHALTLLQPRPDEAADDSFPEELDLRCYPDLGSAIVDALRHTLDTET